MRIDFYTQVHKKQRKMLFDLSTKTADADFSDLSIVTEINQDLMLVTKELRQHAFHEETFVHPLLSKKIPRSEKALHEEHEDLKKYLDDLETNCHHLHSLLPNHTKIQEQGLEFYRMLNR